MKLEYLALPFSLLSKETRIDCGVLIFGLPFIDFAWMNLDGRYEDSISKSLSGNGTSRGFNH